MVDNGDGYVISQQIRGKRGERYQETLLDERGYVWNKDKTYKYSTKKNTLSWARTAKKR